MTKNYKWTDGVITIEQFIDEHKTHYNWTEASHACSEFRRDVKELFEKYNFKTDVPLNLQEDVIDEDRTGMINFLLELGLISEKRRDLLHGDIILIGNTEYQFCRYTVDSMTDIYFLRNYEDTLQLYDRPELIKNTEVVSIEYLENRYDVTIELSK